MQQSEPLINTTEVAQLKKAGLSNVVSEIRTHSDAFAKIADDVNSNPNYSDEYKAAQLNTLGAKAVNDLSNMLLTKHPGSVQEYETNKTKIDDMLSARGTTDLILMGQYASLIAQEKFTLTDVLNLHSLDAARAALLNPVARYRLLADDKDGSSEARLTEVVAAQTLGDGYEQFKQQGFQISIVRELVGKLSARAKAMKAAGVPDA
jgi:hypothetical protein